MHKEEALLLVARVKQDAPEVQATLDDSKASTKGHGYHVQLRFAGRCHTINDAGDWTSIWQAWQWLCLPEEQIAILPRDERIRHEVDGLPMTICQRKDGAWYATFTRDGKTQKKYFGKADPRPRYPLWRK